MEKSSSHVLVLVGSPRREGNSATLAAAVASGVESQGVPVQVRFLDDHLTNFLRDCRTCRKPDGECSIEDGFRDLFFDSYLPARAVVFCSPLYWYGLSGQTKTFFDRTFCYYAASYPKSEDVVKGMTHKKIGLVIASEETYPAAPLGVIHQLQEFCRYTHSEFVGVVRGIGNSRGEVRRDPDDPIAAAETLGRNLLGAHYTDYRIDTVRRGKVWGD